MLSPYNHQIEGTKVTNGTKVNELKMDVKTSNRGIAVHNPNANNNDGKTHFN